MSYIAGKSKAGTTTSEIVWQYLLKLNIGPLDDLASPLLDL